jgi:dienelactone hydrolase
MNISLFPMGATLALGIAVAGCAAGGDDDGGDAPPSAVVSGQGSAGGSGSSPKQDPSEPGGQDEGGGGSATAGSSAGAATTAGSGFGGARGDGGRGGSGSDAGRGGSGGSGPAAGGSGGAGNGGGSTSPEDGAAPVLPPITGECPQLKSGTATIGGLGGISLEVGPKSAEGGGSLIFYWHGTGSTAGEYKFMMPAAVVKEVIGQGGMIVSFQSSLRTGGDCSGTATFSKGDFAIADQIAACAVRDHNIDPRRIYTTGCSAGGLQAGCMAALRSNYVAAAVPNSGGMVFPQPFQSKNHIPAAMTMHGGASDQVVVAFSQTSATFDKSIKEAGGFVVNCNHGGGHCGAPAPLYTAGWQFMKDHPYGTSSSPYQSSLPASFPTYCAKY